MKQIKKIKGWTPLGFSADIQGEQVDRLRSRGYKVHFEASDKSIHVQRTKRVRIHKVHDYASQDYLKPIKALFTTWLMLLALTANVIYMQGVPEVQAMSLERNQFTADINLSPVRFTEAELADIEAKRKELEVKEVYKTDIEQMIYKYFGDDTGWALKCLQSENGRHNLRAINYNRNGSVDRGLFQVNSVHCGKVGGDCERLYDLETNVKVAYQIYKASGPHAWYGKTCN